MHPWEAHFVPVNGVKFSDQNNDAASCGLPHEQLQLCITAGGVEVQCLHRASEDHVECDQSDLQHHVQRSLVCKLWLHMSHGSMYQSKASWHRTLEHIQY